jgi:hypothetical protein
MHALYSSMPLFAAAANAMNADHLAVKSGGWPTLSHCRRFEVAAHRALFFFLTHDEFG